MSRLLDAALLVQADEIILPDVFQDGPSTLNAVWRSLSALEQHGAHPHYKLMAVCQGATAKEFIKCFETLESISEVDVIGIPKVAAKLHPVGRPYFESMWAYSPKIIHLLGVWYGWEELTRYVRPQRIRSVDSCLASFQAKYYLPITAVRPDGHSIDLEDTTISDREIGLRIGEFNHEIGRHHCTGDAN